MNTKADLKAAREAIGSKKFGEAVKACRRVLLWDGQNYNAWVFLGVAYTGLEDDEEAESAYKRAIEINEDTLLAWQGLISFYEKRDKKEEYTQLIQKLLPRLVKSRDGAKVTDYLKKLLSVYKDSDKTKYLDTLKLFIPGSSYYELIKDQPNIPSPSEVWIPIIEHMEQEQNRKIENEVASRRFRVSNETPVQIRVNVETEIYSQSTLGELYQKIIELAPVKDKERWELRLLTFNWKRLRGVKEKTELYKSIIELARKLLSANDPLPYEILIESSNVSGVGKTDHYDWKLINELMVKYPDHGISKYAKGYQLTKEENSSQGFDIYNEALEQSPFSLFGYQCLSWSYFHIKEYESGLEYATKGRDLVLKMTKDTGIPLDKVLLSMELCMAHCYRLFNEKYHIDAMNLYKSLIQQCPNEISVLEGIGYILLKDKRLDEALEYFEKVQSIEKNNHSSLAEIGGIYCDKGQYKEAIQFISKAIEVAGKDVADYFYRLGRVYWDMEDSISAFKYFMKAVKLDPYFGHVFTYLGHYYRVIKHDQDRSKKCYQKAYMLDPLDTEAALHLSNCYIDTGEEDEAEIIFRQICEVAPKTGWAWKHMGYHNLNSKLYTEAITCFQKALRANTNDVQCWEGLGEAYSKVGRYIAALKAFERATTLNPVSIHAHNEQAHVQQKIGLLDKAIAGYRHTIHLAKEQGKENYIPALAGIAETHLENAKEHFQRGFFAQAADDCNDVIKVSLEGLKHDANIILFWKLIGDSCAFYRLIPSYIYLCAYSELQSVMKLIPKDSYKTLMLGPDNTDHWISELLALEDISDDFALPPRAALDVILSCAGYAYKRALIVANRHPSISPAFWHDLALVYYFMCLNNMEEEGNKTSDTVLSMKCCKIAIKLDPTQYLYWNTLGVVAMTIIDHPKLAQAAFIKSMEYNNRSAIPWTNYGFLCLSLKDYELANQAFETAHSLDPEWISAWVGQAYVASLWGTDAAVIFEHAFESSNGSSLEASYGYAETVYSKLNVDMSSTSVVVPIFALEKLAEQKINDALSLNLLGLLLERIGQYGRASESFASAILALEAQVEAGKIDVDEAENRLSKVKSNLGRTLCAAGDFEGAISIYDSASAQTVYAQLNAGIAYYFLDKLPESLSMFELALNATQDDVDIRQDVIVLLSKVLWALGGDEQRSVAKDKLFSSISDSPEYLPAIFSLCVIGMLEDDETLTAAALQELAKVSIHVAYNTDKEESIPYLFSKFYQLQGDSVKATRALIKSVHQHPWLASSWANLSKHIVHSAQTRDMKTIISSSLVMTSKSHTVESQSEAYEYSALADSTDASIAKRYAQRAIMTAPWRIEAWKTLASI
ncbi:hypothetical protein BDB01DRAFT_851026 [Pilobolus umbonatus]|nr:hypothetical protein BDB01DRAFT_851026 [Pilobolus umbonatus]